MMVSKPDDIYWSGWHKVKSVAKIDPRKGDKWRLYPDFENQWDEFYRAYEMVWKEGNWAVCIDELYYAEKVLGLGNEVVKHLTQGRSKKISVVVGMQRPAWVSRFALSEPTHIICFRSGDKRDLKAIREGVSEEFADVVPKLGQFEFAYYHKITQRVERGRVSDLARILGV